MATAAEKAVVVGIISLGTGIIGGATAMGVLMWWVCRKRRAADLKRYQDALTKGTGSGTGSTGKQYAGTTSDGDPIVSLSGSTMGTRAVTKDPDTGLNIEYTPIAPASTILPKQAKPKPIAKPSTGTKYAWGNLFNKPGLSAVEF